MYSKNGKKSKNRIISQFSIDKYRNNTILLYIDKAEKTWEKRVSFPRFFGTLAGQRRSLRQRPVFYGSEP
jgi:hypothetical protein